MLNRSAIVIGYRPAFISWLQTAGVTDEAIRGRCEVASRKVYLIPACHFAEEIDEVVEGVFEEIVRRELASWQPDENLWPDAGDPQVFLTFFTFEGFSSVDDLGRTTIAADRAYPPAAERDGDRTVPVPPSPPKGPPS